jgi:small multidrug resistance family-3 protein
MGHTFGNPRSPLFEISDRMLVSKSVFLFVIAGLCEIGGGYLFWNWLCGGKGVIFAFVGALVLIL